MDAILGTLGVVILLVIGLGAIVLWDDADWVFWDDADWVSGDALKERLARGEITQEQYRTIRRALLGSA